MSINKISGHNQLSILLRVLFVFCVLVSSCSLKYGIKNILNISSSSAAAKHSKAGKFAKTDFRTFCGKSGEQKFTTKIQKVVKVYSFDVWPASNSNFFEADSLLLQPYQYPFKGSAKKGNAVPIFLQYRKLII